MQALGLESCAHTIHDLRDTFATLHLLKDPGRLFWVSWMLGHRQTSTTLNRYTKWVPTQTAGHGFAGDLDRPRLGAKVSDADELTPHAPPAPERVLATNWQPIGNCGDIISGND
jgi:hypothetical protein